MATQLIPGRWYDFREHDFSNDKGKQIAAKLERVDGEDFYWIEAIRSKKGYFRDNANWDIKKELKEFPLEELKKWLPEEEYKKYVGEPDYEIY